MQNVEKLFLNNIGDLIEVQRASYYRFLINGIKEEILRLQNPFQETFYIPYFLKKESIVEKQKINTFQEKKYEQVIEDEKLQLETKKEFEINENYRTPSKMKIEVPRTLLSHWGTYLYAGDYRFTSPGITPDFCLRYSDTYSLRVYLGRFSYFIEHLNLSDLIVLPKVYKLPRIRREEKFLKEKITQIVEFLDLEKNKFTPFSSSGLAENEDSFFKDFDMIFEFLPLFSGDGKTYWNDRKLDNIILKRYVVFAEVPLMTNEGTFIVNGCERVVINQVVRSPGMSFFKNFSNSSATLITENYSKLTLRFLSESVEFWNFYKKNYKEFPTYNADVVQRILQNATNYHLLSSGNLSFENSERLNIKNIQQSTGFTTEQYNEEQTLPYSLEKLPLNEKLERLTSYRSFFIHLLIANYKARDKKKNGVTYRIKKNALFPKNDKNFILIEDTLQNFPFSFIISSSLQKQKIISRSFLIREDFLSLEEKNCLENLTERKHFFPGLQHFKDLEDIRIFFEYVSTLKNNPFELEEKKKCIKTDKKLDNLFLGRVGRYRTNKRTGERIPLECHQFSPFDLCFLLQGLTQIESGLRDPDDIDDLKLKQVRGVGEQIQKFLVQKKRTREYLSYIRPSSLEVDKDFFVKSPLSQYFDQLNPLSEVTHKRRASVFGENGIKRGANISGKMRDIHSSYYGRLCPIETPDGENAGLVTSLALLSKVNAYGLVKTPYYFVKHSEVFLKSSPIFLDAYEEYPAKVLLSNFILEKGRPYLEEKVYTVKDGQTLDTFNSVEVNFAAVHPSQIMSLATGLVPFIEHNDGNRALMGANMQRQALPLFFPHKPIVGTGLETVVALSSGSVIRSYCEGIITYSSSEVVEITDLAQQKLCYLLTKYRHSNQNTALNQIPSCWEGEKVFSGQIIADCLSTCQGELTVGKNLTVAYMPWHGYNYEDAIVLSEKLLVSNSLTSIHIEELESQYFPENEILTKELLKLPNATAAKRRNLDSNGIIRIGSYVRPKDILIAKSCIEITPQDGYALFLQEIEEDYLEGNYKNISLQVPKDTYGRVIDVVFQSECIGLKTMIFPKKRINNISEIRKIILNLCVPSFTQKEKLNAYLDINVEFDEDTIAKTFADRQEIERLLRLNLEDKKQKNKKSFLNLDEDYLEEDAIPFEDENFDEEEFTNFLENDPEYLELQESAEFRKLAGLDDISKDKINNISKTKKEKKKVSNAVFSNDKFLKAVTKQNKVMPFCKPSNFSPMLESPLAFPPNELLRPQTLLFFSPLKLPELFLPVFLFNFLRIFFYLFSSIINLKKEFFFSKRSCTKLWAKDFFQTEDAYIIAWDIYSGQLKTPSSILKEYSWKVKIRVANLRRIEIGDKMSGRHGNKGIISKILPIQDMPFLPDGTPVDILLNPLGVPSRMNVGQLFECLLGFAGEKLGRRFKIRPFDELYGPEASRVLVNKKLQEAAVVSLHDWVFSPDYPGKIFLRDGQSGEYFDNPITVGKTYFLKLLHIVHEKIHTRSLGPYNLVTEQPLGGKASNGGQRFGEMEVWALEAHGCSSTLHEILTVRSDDVETRKAIIDSFYFGPLDHPGHDKAPAPVPDPNISEAFLVLIRELQALGLDFSFSTINCPTDRNIQQKRDLFISMEKKLQLKAMREKYEIELYFEILEERLALNDTIKANVKKKNRKTRKIRFKKI